jgi:maltose alpha-D-glucosyltransferase/alpha-amylase
VDPDGEVTALALLQRYVPNQGDAWTFSLHELTRELEASITAPAAASAPAAPAPSTAEGTPAEAITTTTAIPVITGAEPIEAADGVRPMARTMGRRTAQLHAALAQRTGDPAFDPEPVTQSDVTQWAYRVRQDIVATIEALESAAESLPAHLGRLASDVVASAPGLVRRVEAWANHPAAGVKTRYHGSYNLEQVMLVENDYVIIDLEGEQGVPIAEARRKSSALRDVASMLRSFDYARRVALAQATQHEGDMERMAPAAAAWLESARAAFLAAYREEAVSSGLYADEAAFDAQKSIIAMFELEKALYELRFELENRPEWVGIPLSGLASLAARDGA